MTQLPSYSTPRQVADYLTNEGVAVTEDAVRRWCREEKIPSITLPGGQYRIKREDAEAILVGSNPSTAGA